MFLNIYPKHIWTTLNATGSFEGKFTFAIEQYGLLYADTECDVTFVEDSILRGEWRLQVEPLLDVDMPHFDKFVKTLNHYVFNVLKVSPTRSAVSKELPSVKVFFDGIYFDMSGVEPVVQKLADKSGKT
jgi:hypothetical protein